MSMVIANAFDWMVTAGPGEFLRGYAIALGVALAAGVLLRFGLGWLHDDFDDGELSAYEAAYLKRGYRGLTHAVVAKLLRAECVTVQATSGRLKPGTRKSSGQNALEVAVMSIATAGGDLNDAVRSVTHSAYGMVASLKERKVVQSTTRRCLKALLQVVPTMVVIGFGAWRMYIGVSRDRPIGYLLALTAIGGVLAVLLVLSEGVATPMGRRALRRARKEHPKEVHTRAASSADWAWMCGLYGVTALPSSADAFRHAVIPQNSESGGGFFGGGGCGGSGGCGGGCGVGGCGG